MYLTKHNTKCYGVTFQNNGWIKVQKFEDFPDDENNIYCVKLLETFIGKSRACHMTAMSGTFDRKVFNG